MDKKTLSNYGWIVAVVLVLVILLSLATPFASVIRGEVVDTTETFIGTANGAFDGIEFETSFDSSGSGGGDLGGGSGSGGSENKTATLEGDGQTFYTLAPSELTFRSTEPIDTFEEVTINGQTIDPSYYTVTEGSTIITLSVEYLQTLSEENYNIVVVSENCDSLGEFDVIEQKVNSKGFYYDVPYLLEDYFYRVGIMMNRNGTLYLVSYDTDVSYPVETYSYVKSGNDIVCEGLVGVVSDDGLEIFVDGMGTFVVATDIAVSEGEYFYPCNPFKDYANSFVLDKTKTTYEPTLTNINAKEIHLDGTYRDCVNLETITLPVGIKIIGTECFENCTSLKYVSIPATVTKISSTAFYNCSNLIAIDFNGTKEQWNKITKEVGWNKFIPATTVFCTDGIITL